MALAPLPSLRGHLEPSLDFALELQKRCVKLRVSDDLPKILAGVVVDARVSKGY